MYFSEHQFVVEIDEKCHIDRNVEGYNIFLEISKMQNYITKSNENEIKDKFTK